MRSLPVFTPPRKGVLGSYKKTYDSCLQKFSCDKMRETTPFALAPTDEDAKGTFTPVLTGHQVAWEPLPFNQGDEDQFLER